MTAASEEATLRVALANAECLQAKRNALAVALAESATAFHRGGSDHSARLMDGRGQGAFDGPPAMQPRSQHIRGQFKSSRPFGDAQCFSVVRDATIAPRILILFAACGPSNVPRLIAESVVDAVYRVLRRGPSSNVREEGREVVPPFVRDGDAAPAVSGVMPIAGVETAILHHLPRPVLGRWLASDTRIRFAVGGSGANARTTDAAFPARGLKGRPAARADDGIVTGHRRLIPSVSSPRLLAQRGGTCMFILPELEVCR